MCKVIEKSRVHGSYLLTSLTFLVAILCLPLICTAHDVVIERNVNLRGIGNTYTILQERNEGKARVIGTVDAVRAFHECHDGAIYLHRGQQFLVRSMSVEDRKRVLEEVVGAVGDRVLIVAQTGALDTHTAVELTRHAREKRIGI